jgi:hypothetical protein
MDVIEFQKFHKIKMGKALVKLYKKFVPSKYSEEQFWTIMKSNDKAFEGL